MRRFEGPCYGGVLDGQSLSFGHDYYRVALLPRLKVCVPTDEPSSAVNVDLHTQTYRWLSRPVGGCWVLWDGDKPHFNPMPKEQIAKLRDALEDLTIAVGMGWEHDSVMTAAEKVLEETETWRNAVLFSYA